jgi:hypothetical protein
MAKIANRLFAAVLAFVALIFCSRAVAIFLVLTSTTQNIVPVAKGANGYPVCPPQIFFTAETEQTLTILVSLIVVAVAWFIWRRSTSPQH